MKFPPPAAAGEGERAFLYFGRERRPVVIFGAGLWRCLEIAFMVFMGVGAIAGLSYLYKPILKLMRKRAPGTAKGK